MTDAISFSGTMTRFSSYGVAIFVPSAARMTDCSASGEVVKFSGRESKRSTTVRTDPPDRTDRGQEQPRRQKAGDDCGREERPEEADHAAHVRRSSRHVRKGNAPACIRGPRALSFRYAARPTTSECRRAARPTTLRRRAVGPVLAPAED
jgi:hypothetical protein